MKSVATHGSKLPQPARVTAGSHKGKVGQLVGFRTGRAVVQVGRQRLAFYVDELEPIEPTETHDPCGEPHARRSHGTLHDAECSTP